MVAEGARHLAGQPFSLMRQRTFQGGDCVQEDIAGLLLEHPDEQRENDG